MWVDNSELRGAGVLAPARCQRSLNKTQPTAQTPGFAPDLPAVAHEDLELLLNHLPSDPFAPLQQAFAILVFKTIKPHF